MPQQAVCLLPGKAGEPAQVSVPYFDPSSDASTLYASLFTAQSDSSKPSIQVQNLPLNNHLQAQDHVLLIHASSSSSNDPLNRLANEVLLQHEEDQTTSSSTSITGTAYILYAEQGKDFTVRADWEPLHDVCYGAHLARRGKSDGASYNLEGLASQFMVKRDEVGESEDTTMEEDPSGEGDDAWTDEEVEKPREPKKDVESSDDEEGGDTDVEEDEDEEEEEDSEGSYEDESELEDDEDDNDPRKKALLEMIQAAIMKDGKLDLER